MKIANDWRDSPRYLLFCVGFVALCLGTGLAWFAQPQLSTGWRLIAGFGGIVGLLICAGSILWWPRQEERIGLGPIGRAMGFASRRKTRGL